MFPVEDIVNGFILLLESAEDIALDIPDAANELALFLARAIIDNILSPLNLEEIDSQLKPGSIGSKIVCMACSLLGAFLVGECILRCWGGGTSWEVEDAVPIPVGLLPTRDRNYYSITGDQAKYEHVRTTECG